MEQLLIRGQVGTLSCWADPESVLRCPQIGYTTMINRLDCLSPKSEDELCLNSPKMCRNYQRCKWHSTQRQLHSVPVIWSSDIWSFRIFGQLLDGPNFHEYTRIHHISRIWPELRLHGQILDGPNVNHISGTECIDIFQKFSFYMHMGNLRLFPGFVDTEVDSYISSGD